MRRDAEQKRKVEAECLVVPLRQWLALQGLSKSWYYKFAETSLAPETVLLGGRRFVTVAAARRWAERLERAGAA